MLRLDTKDKQFIHHLNKEKASANVTFSVYSHVKEITITDSIFLGREILGMGYYLPLNAQQK